MAKILIVDGQQSIRQYLSALLTSAGHEVLEAGDSLEALAILGTKTPDLIVADVLTRMMDGYELVNNLRAKFASPPPVIFWVDGSYETQARIASVEFGVEHVLAKHCPPESVLGTIDTTLARRCRKSALSKKIDLAHFQFIPPVATIDAEAIVFIADDDPAMRNLLSATMVSAGLKAETYSSAEEFLDAYGDRPGCLLTDIQMTGMTGIELLLALRAKRMHIPTMIMTGRGDLEDIRQAMKLQAREFLDKSVDRRTLLTRVYSALQEDTAYRRTLNEVKSCQGRMSSLTVRERDLIALLIEGKASKEIASALNISIKTVSIHRGHLMAKTGASNVADLVRMSMIARKA